MMMMNDLLIQCAQEFYLLAVVSCLQAIKTYGLQVLVQSIGLRKLGRSNAKVDEILDKVSIESIKVSFFPHLNHFGAISLNKIRNVKDLRKSIDQIREKILFETFMNLKQHQIKNLVRSPIDDIIRLRERIESQQLTEIDTETFTAMLLDQEDGPSMEDVLTAFGSTQALDVVFQST